MSDPQLGPDEADVIVVGHGLAGLVACGELLDAGKRVILVDQEPAVALGGQAFWSFGGLFLIDSPEQRRLGVHDSPELARQDWFASAGFDRDDEDHWARRWAEAYLDFAAGEKRAWLRAKGIGIFPLVGWAERGGSSASGHGNSVPRFHIAWGTGPGVVAPFSERVQAAAADGTLTLRHRHRVDELIIEGDAVTGIRGAVLADDPIERGQSSSRDVVADFELRAGAVILATGGIGGNHELVRAAWPQRLGTPPDSLLSGVPEHVDGRMLGIAARAGARLVNGDRMWHYVEGIANWNPIWPQHGIRILPGPSSMWFDAVGNRLPAPNYPGFDTLSTLEHLMKTGYDHSWFVLTQKIIEKEFALSGSEQNPDLTGKDLRKVLRRVLPGAPEPVEAFKRHGADFVVAENLAELFDGMLAKTDAPLDTALIERQLRDRDRELANTYSKDPQIQAIRGARRFLGDRLGRVAAPHRILDPAAGPLIAVKLHILTRKSLGGIQTNLDGQVLTEAGEPLPGLYAAGEVAGFGGGGMHGYRALEGTFLGGCLFSGRVAGRAAARA